ncbi:MAG TPA: hypothetical protein VL551_28255 [Actinospica sp.]|jgi:hypothetical protein|nr:hypothetical protein [Actinospica sp.]
MTPSNHRRNPFHELGLPVDATNAQIVERAEELVQTCRDAAERDRIVRAKDELITHPLTRAKHERAEPARTDYERAERWSDFVHDNRRAPVSARALTEGAALSAADFDLASAVRVLTRWSVQEEFAAAGPPRLELPSTEADGVARVEVRDVLFG